MAHRTKVEVKNHIIYPQYACGGQIGRSARMGVAEVDISSNPALAAIAKKHDNLAISIVANGISDKAMQRVAQILQEESASFSGLHVTDFDANAGQILICGDIDGFLQHASEECYKREDRKYSLLFDEMVAPLRTDADMIAAEVTKAREVQAQVQNRKRQDGRK